jgi:hypothetical protein
MVAIDAPDLNSITSDSKRSNTTVSGIILSLLMNLKKKNKEFFNI